jgi:flagella basal body P-ring formation protein FlgA
MMTVASHPLARPRPPGALAAVGIVAVVGRFCSRALLLGALTGGVSWISAFAGSPAFELQGSAQVDSSGIFLHQLVSAPLSLLPAQPVRLSAAPAFGRAASLTRTQIEQLLALTLPELRLTNWSGAEAVRITRRARVLGEAELRDLLTATLQKEVIKERGELELRFSRPWPALQVPDEMLLLRVLDLPATGVSANFIMRFELQAGPDRLGPWQAVLQARVMKDVLIAQSPVRRGQPLQPSDFTAERRDVLGLREPLDDSALRNPSLELVEGVSAGQPLLARTVRMRPVLQRGQMVDGLVRDGTLQINLRVEVLADGQPGQLIRVRNPKTKREFYGKVQDEQTVLIHL